MRCSYLLKPGLQPLNPRVLCAWYRFEKRQAVDDDDEDGNDPDAMEL